MKKSIFENKASPLYAVLFGGVGYERQISVLSAANFLRAAKDEGFSVLPVYIDANGSFYIYEGDISALSADFAPDYTELIPTFPMQMGNLCGFYVDGKIIEVRLCVPVLHGDYGEDGIIQGLLQSARIPFAGADTVCGAVAADKAYTKAVAASVKVPVVESFVYNGGKENIDKCVLRAEKTLGYPLFVKPCRLGSSVGAGMAECREEFITALLSALDVSERVLIERAVIEKRELECAYLAIGDIRLITAPGEAVSEKRFYDYDAKYKSSKTRLFPVADVDDNVKDKIISYTETLADALSVRHIARFDYFLSADGEIYFNEVNTFPGMTEGSLYPAMLKEAGIDFRSFVRLLFTNGGVRW